MKSIIHAKNAYDKTKPLISKVGKIENLKTKPPSANSKVVGPKRDKLKNLLVVKYMKMFGLVEESKILNDEVGRLLSRDKVNDHDLKVLEKNLAIIFNRSNTGTNLEKTQNKSQPTLTQNNVNVSTMDFKRDKLPPINNNATMSRSMADLNEEDDFLDERKPKKEITKNGDEWDKIIAYNKKTFENDKKQREIKKEELKVKTKINLESQIHAKEERQMHEVEEKAEFFNYILKDVEAYHKSEKDKENEMKRKIMKEKEIRDKQLREEKLRKKIQSADELAHDKVLLQQQLDIIENEKRAAIARKKKDKEAYNKIQLDNIEFKKYQAIMRQKERDSDIEAMEEYARILTKQEQARADYFKKCENRQSDFMSKMAENVVKVNDNKLAMEDEKIMKYQSDRDKANLLEEQRRKKKLADKNYETKLFLDMQINFKKKEGEEDRKNGLIFAKHLQEECKIFENQEKQKEIKVSLILLLIKLTVIDERKPTTSRRIPSKANRRKKKKKG